MPEITAMDLVCPLCHTKNSRYYNQDEHREYLHCQTCELVFVPRVYHLPPDQEKKGYELEKGARMRNRYSRQLKLLVGELSHRLPRGARGLDFGSGPSPELPAVLADLGYVMEVFDPYYAPNRKALGGSYDFLTCSGVVEYFHDPYEEWKRLFKILRPGGLLGLVMDMGKHNGNRLTNAMTDDAGKVGFYSDATLRWLAERYQLDVKYSKEGVVLLRQKMGV
ncbi:MAG TPA: class I SAM-dependent methyltransferase [Calditrichia bacterium]|nr:class I SAM-dependent methyltransferase [Calditrichia bacterium]